MKRFFLAVAAIFTLNLASAQTLRIAVYQYADNPRIKNLQPFAARLQQESGLTTAVKSYPTVHALITAMQQNEVDIAFTSTFGYLLLQAGNTAHPMLPVAALVAPNAKDNYKTAIVSKKGAGIASFADLKNSGAGKRLAFVATGSTSGNLVPRLLLNGVGIDADRHFSSVQYAGTHAKALAWLLSDSADVAAMGSTEWDKLDSAKKSSLQLLLLSSEIPLGPVLLNKAMNAQLQKQITDVLLALHQTNAPALEAIKAAWSEAKQATHFISIGAGYYEPYLKQFGNRKDVEATIKKFIQ
ncbi:MAG TPA: phosphate/phosphite/phosphonate ABC transporter substrate-binding protein [Flavisolibacter sp.]|nr:phosphate/phosphite/phosphonate ABC transporter substrate-binding protein [Flavisolibacter sp.]